MSHNKTVQIRNSTAEFLIFSYHQGGDEVNVRIYDGTIWLTNKSISELFEISTENIRLHFKNVFQEGELLENSVTQKYLATATDGKNYHTKHYNLDAITGRTSTGAINDEQ